MSSFGNSSDVESGGDLDLREVSQLHARWQEGSDGEPGSFVLVVILDDGALEIEARPPSRILEAGLQLIANGETVLVDLHRGAVVIGNIRIPVG